MSAVLGFPIYRLLKRLLRLFARYKTLLALSLLAPMVVVNALLFYYVEVVVGGRSDLDLWAAFYWAIVTMATVGYGDIVPKTFWGRVVATEAIVAGIAVFTLMVTTLAEFFMHQTLKRIMGWGRLRRVDVVVVGSTEICRESIEELKLNMPGARIGWVLEKRPREIPEDVDFVVGSPTDENTLSRAGIKGAKYLIVCVPSDSKAIHIVLTARRLNRNLRIVAIANSSRAQELLREAGASTVIPLRMVGRALASAVFEPSVSSFIEEVTTARGEADLIEVQVDGNRDNVTTEEYVKNLEQSDKGSRYVPLMIVREGKNIIAPQQNVKLRAGDKLLLLKAKKSGEREEA